MNLMEFKIAVIGEQLYGDISLIAPDKNGKKEQEHKGFYDEGLTKLVNQGTGNEPLKEPIRVRDRNGGNEITFKNKMEIAN